jgi:hypothetical protein
MTFTESAFIAFRKRAAGYTAKRLVIDVSVGLRSSLARKRIGFDLMDCFAALL